MDTSTYSNSSEQKKDVFGKNFLQIDESTNFVQLIRNHFIENILRTFHN